MTVTVLLRATKGSPLTNSEVDANFLALASGVNAALADAGGSPYTLPAATTSTLGGVKAGSGLSIGGDGTLSLNLTSGAVTSALGFTPAVSGSGVTSFNTRTGAVSLTSEDVASALGFTPTNLTSGAIVGALGYTPAVSGSGVTSFNTRTGAVSLTSGDVTTALGFTPANQADIAGILASLQDIYSRLNAGGGGV